MGHCSLGRVSPLAGLLQPGLEYSLALWDKLAWIIEPLWLSCRVGHVGWTVGWDTVAWVRVSPLAGLLQPGLECTP